MQSVDWQPTTGNVEGVITLTPDPVLKDVTYALAEKALSMMNVDMPAFMRGEPCEAKPPVGQARTFLRLVLENADVYDIDAWPLGRVRAVVEAVAAHFFFDCIKSLRGLEIE